MPEYWGAIPKLCQDLFDYGCAKCLGAEIDFKAQEAAIDTLGDFIREHQSKLDHAIKAGDHLREEAEKLALKDAAAEVTERQKKSEQLANKGWGYFGLLWGLCFS